MRNAEFDWHHSDETDASTRQSNIQEVTLTSTATAATVGIGIPLNSK